MIQEFKPRFQKKGDNPKELEEKLINNFNQKKDPIAQTKELEEKIRILREGMPQQKDP